MKRSHDDAVGEDRPGEQDGMHDDSDDEVGMIPPYDAKKEAHPASKLYDPQYQKIQDFLQQCVMLLETPLRETSFSNGSTSGLQEELRRRVKDNSAEKVKIGVVGDMKSGKVSQLPLARMELTWRRQELRDQLDLECGRHRSSGMFNPLHFTDLVLMMAQGDAGSSCTWVVNEFCYLLPNQSKTFAAEVYFFSQEERYEIIRCLLADYFRASGKDNDKSDGEKDADQSVDDFATTQTVVTSLRALFIGYSEFSTNAKVHDFLSQATSEDDSNILATLFELSDRVMAECLQGHPSIRVEAATPQNLLLQLAAYQYTVQERGVPSPSLWPFVNHIKFGLECELLKSVTLIDLPGLSDANKTRAATSTAHLRTCTHYMVVAEIGRATDDKFIREHLQKGYVTRGSGNTILILTHADSIDDATEVEMTRKGQQQLDAYEAQIVELEKKKKDHIIKAKRTPKGMQQYEYMAIRDQAIAEIRETTGKHKELRIHARSRNICRFMQQIYEDLTSDSLKLAVYCVGNLAYKKHQAGYSMDDANPPTLSAEGTNIPLLRQHLFLTPAAGRLNETQNQVMVQLPVLTNACGLYASKTHMARKDEIERVVTDPQRMLGPYIDTIFQELRTSIESKLLDPFRDEEFEWVTEAQDLCVAWARGYTTAKHLAMLKNDGVQKGRTKGNSVVSWNGELININSEEIRGWARECLPSFQAATTSVHRDVTMLADRMLRKISSKPVFCHLVRIC